MGQCQPRQWTSADALRASGAAWDNLWQRSEVSLPTARAELVATWRDWFAPRAAFRALAVEQDGQLVAALPLVGRRIRRFLPVADLTWNYWSPNAELLLDPTANLEQALDLLVDQIRRLRWPLLWLEMIPAEFAWWKALLERLGDRGVRVDLHPRYEIGQVEIRGAFDAYLGSRSQQQVRSLRKDLRQLQRSGHVSLHAMEDLAPEEVEAPLRQAFQLEERSWRNQRGSTVLDTPGVFEFYRRQARELAAWQELRLYFLTHEGRPIAFEFGWTAKGVYHSFKVGYDQEYRRSSPGHLLRMLLLERFFQQSEIRVVDFQGPLTDAMAVWSTRQYPIARLVVACGRRVSRSLLAGYRASAQLIRSLRSAKRKA